MRPRPPARARGEIADSALADIAFLLLIFFLATTIIADEYGLSLLLPPKGGERRRVNPDNVLVLTSDDLGTSFFADGEPVPLSDVESLVRERGAANPNLVVRLSPHRRAPYNAMVQLLDEVKGADARRISLGTGR